MSLTKLQTKTHSLIVEGSDDLYVISNLIQRERPSLQGDWPKFIKTAKAKVDDRGGAVGAAIREFCDATLASTSKRLGLVIDANGDFSTRWRQVQEGLGARGVVAAMLPSTGLIIERPNQRIGVWFWPNCQSPGALENFLWELVPADDVKAYAMTAVTEARKRGAPCNDAAELKARFRTWLAWQEQPGLPPGDAIHRGVVPGSTPTVDTFTKWFEQLFIED